MPAFRKLQPQPFRECFHQQSHVGRLQGEPANKTALRAVASAQSFQTPAAPGDLGEAAIVSAHKIKEWPRDRLGKWRNQKRFRTDLKRLRGDTKVVEAQIQGKGQAHQIELAHVFVFVFEDRFEPAAVTAAEIAVVPHDPLLHWLAAPLGRDQFRRAARRK